LGKPEAGSGTPMAIGGSPLPAGRQGRRESRKVGELKNGYKLII